MATQTTSLEQLPVEVMRLVDALDLEALGQMLTDDAQSVDEISGSWIRGRKALEAYFEQLKDAVSDVHSSVRDVQAVEWGDSGAATFVLEQSYNFDGGAVRVTAPTSFFCRREDGRWKIGVFHSVPLADDEDSE